jgi:protein-tyrosine phosphatase
VIDLHSHILPGLDDGVRTVDEARELARTAVAEGVTALAATPHVRDDYPTTVAQMEEGVATLVADFAREGIDLELLTGGEIGFDRLGLADDDLRAFTLGRSGRYLLVECPYSGWPLALDQLFRSLRDRGFTPILAHPERNNAVQANAARLRPLVEAGGLVQVTAGSLAGTLGRAARAAARVLVELELVHLVASDAHAPAVRRYSLAAGVRALEQRDLGRWLSEDAPLAIVRGEELPQRPRVERRRRLLRRRF